MGVGMARRQLGAAEVGIDRGLVVQAQRHGGAIDIVQAQPDALRRRVIQGVGLAQQAAVVLQRAHRRQRDRLALEEGTLPEGAQKSCSACS